MPILNFGGDKTPLTFDERMSQLTNAKNKQYQAPHSAGLGAPQTFILRNRSSNAFIHRIETEHSEEVIKTHTTILTNASSESQAFLNSANNQALEVSKRIVQFATDMFALEVGTGLADDFMLGNLPAEIDYTGYVQTVVPKLEQALVKRLAVDIGIDLFECPEILEGKVPTHTDNSSILERLSTLIKSGKVGG